MKNLFILFCLVCQTYSNLNSQISSANFTYEVLKNDLGLKVCKGVFELDENILLFDDTRLIVYNEGSRLHSFELPLDQTIDAISILNDVIYCAVYDVSGYTMKIFDKTLNETQSIKLDFLFSDFEKTTSGYFFFNSKLIGTDQPILFFTDDNFAHSKTYFESSVDNWDIMIATTSKLVRKDGGSVYFNLPGTGEIYEVNENGSHTLIYNMGTEPNGMTGDVEINQATIKNLAKNAPIRNYAICESYLVFFSQKNGNYIYFYNRITKKLNYYPAAIQYDLMDKFDFNRTCPSTFLNQRNKFAALLKGRDIHLIKDIVTPSSKTDHIPNCNKNDLILMTFDVNG